MLGRLTFLPAFLGAVLTLHPALGDAPGRWSKEQANAWAKRQGWLLGCNYLPSTAVNSLEMFQAESFDAKTIDRELGWAESLGYNSVRIFLNSLLWQQDGKGFLKRLDKFLTIADKHHIGAAFVLFDSCWDPNPTLGKQPDPIPRVHNSRWVQSPGSWTLKDAAKREALKHYVLGVVGHFRNDRRVQWWDIWNEPEQDDSGPACTHPMNKEEKLRLVILTLEKAFAWARQAKPSQPLTSGLLGGPWNEPEKLAPLQRLQWENSDVLSFHCYEPLSAVKVRVESLRRQGRPILCTEFMARTYGSMFDPILGYFHDQGVAAYSAALVEGKIQTKFPWDSLNGRKYDAEPSPWFHDVFHNDGRPYDQREVEYIRRVTGVKR
jgi:hypothetical protein